MYHPAALERAADSINGVETQGLGRSGDDILPIAEDNWVVFCPTADLNADVMGSSRVVVE